MKDMSEIIELEEERKDTKLQQGIFREEVLQLSALHEYSKDIKRECSQVKKNIRKTLFKFIYDIIDDNKKCIDHNITIREESVYEYDSSSKSSIPNLLSIDNISEKISKNQADYVRCVLDTVRGRQELLSEDSFSSTVDTEDGEIAHDGRILRFSFGNTAYDKERIISFNPPSNRQDAMMIVDNKEGAEEVIRRSISHYLELKSTLQEILINLKTAIMTYGDDNDR